ncbi:CesT family type III secretion system chaperone [Pseudochelatococcus lubricantis]|uniref:CesT family type III secretion system chaperone n=1 Tax=Pseudochelatococcus lubricantis TaxID=1538102 RepID=UPI0035EA0E32
MSFIANHTHIIQEFGKLINIPELALDEDGYCCLGFDDVVLDIEYKEHLKILLVHSRIGTLPDQPWSALLEKLQDMSYATLIMGTGAIGIDRHARRIMFIERIPLRGLTPQDFEAAIEAIVDRVEKLTATINAPDFVSRSDDAPVHGAPFADIHIQV